MTTQLIENARQAFLLVSRVRRSTLALTCTPLNKGDVTRDDSQRRFLAEHSVATLFRIQPNLFNKDTKGAEASVRFTEVSVL